VGRRRDGVFYRPTVLTAVPRHAKVMKEEVFGPVVSITPVEDLVVAVEQANDSPYALQAGIFTADLDLALHVADRLDFGAVMINDTGDFRIDAMPFGGRQRAGTGREGVRYAVEGMTEPKIIAIRQTGRSSASRGCAGTSSQLSGSLPGP
jgi:glyceraldehyde-3-phosphate dehydrogenase (NADP+)